MILPVGVEQWMKLGNRGVSSNTMVEVFLGLPTGFVSGVFWEDNHPKDPSDFNRCYELLRCAPEFKPKLPMMSRLSKEWETLVLHWDELETLLMRERESGIAPNLYIRMQELFAACRAESDTDEDAH